MSRIRRLPDHLVNQIAAGEVVERPASVVKELIENAIDAEAQRIMVDLRDAGRQLVRVTDDGTGMSAEELPWALTRHATSKIASEADLAAIGTLGFRGEALPAICAVSRFSLQSCPGDGETGTRVRGEGGVVRECIPVVARRGTVVEVGDLFFNTPARLKFLKGARSEQAATLRIVQGIALAHPEIYFHVTHDGRPALTAPVAKGLRDRVGALLGFDLARGMLDVSRAEGSLRVTGLVAPPSLARGNREITLIVNGRPVRDSLLTQTVLGAYRPLLARDLFPASVIEIGLPPHDVDVNVHPAKAWVRFRNARLVQELVWRAVYDALRSDRVVPSQAGLSVMAPELAPTAPAGSARGPGAGEEGRAAVVSEAASGLFKENESRFHPGLFGSVIGQLQDTFVVSASEEEVFFVDQHVAHERVVFERLKQDLESGALPSQELLFPEPVELAPGHAELLEEWAPTLARLGFALEGFGGRAVLLRALPTLLKGHEPRRLVERLLDEVAPGRKREDAPLLDRTLAFVACRAAIKAHAVLERQEMIRLLADLSATATPYFCPHGRPIVSRLSLREIKRELRRTW